MKEEVSWGDTFSPGIDTLGGAEATQNNPGKVTWMLYIHIQLSDLGVGRRV
jgi:hypothetical protein